MRVRVALIVGALALATTPAFAASHKPAEVPPPHPGAGGEAGAPDYSPAPPSPPPQAKAYGVYCQTESRKHVAGQKLTPFAACVVAMARTRNQGLTPRQACQGLSKKHVKGQKRTPFAACVVAAAKLRHDETTGSA